MLRAVQLAALAAVETSPAHCPHTFAMLAATSRDISKVLQVIRPVPGHLNEPMVSAQLRNLDMLLAPASGDLGTLLSGYFLDQGGHLDALRD